MTTTTPVAAFAATATRNDGVVHLEEAAFRVEINVDIDSLHFHDIKEKNRYRG